MLFTRTIGFPCLLKNRCQDSAAAPPQEEAWERFAADFLLAARDACESSTQVANILRTVAERRKTSAAQSDVGGAEDRTM